MTLSLVAFSLRDSTVYKYIESLSREFADAWIEKGIKVLRIV